MIFVLHCAKERVHESLLPNNCTHSHDATKIDFGQIERRENPLKEGRYVEGQRSPLSGPACFSPTIE